MLFVCDLHVHIGAAGNRKPVKITASRDLTFHNIARECVTRKGIDVVGVVDCASPHVIEDIRQLIDSGELVQLEGGGLRYLERLTVIPGAEFETREPGGGMSHHVGYFPTIGHLADFADEMAHHVTNITLSSQACGLRAADLCEIILRHSGLMVPAHCFTPHKSVYGACTSSARELFDNLWQHIPAIELGLSADSFMADRICELADRTFVTNSDAHSLPRIGREYTIFEMEDADFAELRQALQRENNRRVVANYGLDPRLGKYHRTCCEQCRWIAREEPPVLYCEQCGSAEVTCGVLDRISHIADTQAPNPPAHRAPYQYQVPLQFVPGVGAVMLNRLINRFGSEMAVLHHASFQELGETVGGRVAELIIKAREGTLALQAGGGGRYGRAVREGDAQFRLPGV